MGCWDHLFNIWELMAVDSDRLLQACRLTPDWRARAAWGVPLPANPDETTSVCEGLKDNTQVRLMILTLSSTPCSANPNRLWARSSALSLLRFLCCTCSYLVEGNYDRKMSTLSSVGCVRAGRVRAGVLLSSQSPDASRFLLCIHLNRAPWHPTPPHTSSSFLFHFMVYFGGGTPCISVSLLPKTVFFIIMEVLVTVGIPHI